MKVCVIGIWHLGAVTSACLSSLGHFVTGWDDNLQNVDNLNKGIPPLYEPGLGKLIESEIQHCRLVYTIDLKSAVSNAEILWVTFDTPVDQNDRADVDYVFNRLKQALKYLPNEAIIIISSQLPVGSIRSLEKYVSEFYPDKSYYFSCVPENLRLGKALNVFLNPDRLIVGFRNSSKKHFLNDFLLTITKKIEWMSIESAEMTKHAINAFLATSVTFINEIASICEAVGADAKEVERGLKTEDRIGPKAYLSPGGPFSGGTLARDVQFLTSTAAFQKLPIPLVESILQSNEAHKSWAKRKFLHYFRDLKGIVVALWGLTYKADTDTLRRSLSVELCNWLLEQGATLHIVDPAVKVLPDDWRSGVIRFDSPFDALSNANALVIGTEWPFFRECVKENLNSRLEKVLILDPNRFIFDLIDPEKFKYLAVGMPINQNINLYE